MIEKPRNDRLITFHTYLVNHGYDEQPFDYVLEQTQLDVESRWPFYAKGKIARAALEQVWGSFAPASMKRAYEIQNQQKAEARAAATEPPPLPEPDDYDEIPF